jgi:hypothetical protein
MKRELFSRLCLVILLCVLMPGAGCSTTKSMYRSVQKKVLPKKDGLKKRALVLPFLDQSRLGKAKVEQMTTTFLELLKKDGHLVVEEMGMNVLVTVVLSPFEVHSERSGIWPFRKVKKELEVSMVVNAFDITNGTLFLTNLESSKIEMIEDIWEGEEEQKEIDDEILNEVDIDEFNKAISQILEDQASAVTRVLSDQPWSGRILSADGKTIIINAGADVGLTQGRVFEVFGRGESIRSASKRPLYLSGPKLGEIKTVNVMEDYSSAIPLTGGQFEAGQVIRVKN